MAQEPKYVLVRMHEDLQRALEKAPEDRRWVMVIDLRNENTIGSATSVFDFGQPGDQRIAGDWNGDGIDTNRKTGQACQACPVFIYSATVK